MTDLQIAANNTITVGNGNNIIFGGSGKNTIVAGLAGTGSNIIFGSNGEVSYLSPNALDTAQTIDSGIGGDDVITAGNGSNYVFGGYGSDSISLGGVTSPNPSQSSASIVVAHNGLIDFDPATNLPKTVYSVDNATGGNATVHTAAGNNVIIGGAGNNWLYGGTGNDVIFGAGGRVDWIAGTEIIQSIDLREGGNDFLSGGGGRDIMIGGIGKTSFVGSFTTDIMIGRFAYIVEVGGRVKEVDCFWFGDDPLANPLSSLYSTEAAGSGAVAVRPITPPAAWGTGLVGVEIEVGGASGLLALNSTALDLQAQQQEQSSHPGSYMVQNTPPANEPESQPEQQAPGSGSGPQEQQEQPGAPGQGQQSNQPPAGDNDQSNPPPEGQNRHNQQINVKGALAKGKTDKLHPALEGFVAFGAAAAVGAGKDVRIDREGFKRLKEEQRRRRFLPWFGGKVTDKNHDRMSTVK